MKTIPTPETDELLNQIHNGRAKSGCLPKEFARSLERRLAVAVDALSYYAESPKYGGEARKALESIKNIKCQTKQ